MAFELKPFTVKITRWVNGTLHNLEFSFNSFEQAFEFAKNTEADTIKILNQNDEEVYSRTGSE